MTFAGVTEQVEETRCLQETEIQMIGWEMVKQDL